MLAEMGTVGLGLDPWMLLQHGQVARGHLKRIEQEVSSLLLQPAAVACRARLSTPYGFLWHLVCVPSKHANGLPPSWDGCMWRAATDCFGHLVSVVQRGPPLACRQPG